MKKILVIIITKDYVMKKCYESVLRQDYPNFSVMISSSKPEQLHQDPVTNRWFNLAKHRSYARKLALASDVDYFFWVDSDIELPKYALSNLMKQLNPPVFDERHWENIKKMFPDRDITPKQKHIIGGWYPLNKTAWNCSSWVADNTISSYLKPQQSVIRVDKIDMGCVLMAREVLEKVDFKNGFSIVVNKNINACECLMFARDAQDAGYELFMDGSVICKHLHREGLLWRLKTLLQDRMQGMNYWMAKLKAMLSWKPMRKLLSQIR
jgi:glycosyltransferase involved in cell wall biosynthesis